MSDYDISKAFEEIENELIDSMMRNFSRHRAEETKEGYHWTQWQAEQLKALEEYRKTNAQKFGKQFKSINSKVEEMIHTARADGNAEQEVKILEAVKNGFTPHMPTGASTGEFFKVNDRKLNALVKSTTDDLKRAETAVLRMSNDKYRKAIFNAQVYANTGAGTYEKAVDMACKDMLNAGLNCVEYKNGARHTLSDYADMAIKTANKRAYLRGEGEERAKYGLSLVVVNSRQGGCSDCAKYIGRVFIDDVYSNGKKSDGDYPLLSTAIAEGLFHPRCKDSTSTYYPELDDLDKPLSDDEIAELDRQRGLEEKQQYAERQAQRFDRRAKYSLDEDNKKFAKARADEWHDRADKLEKNISNEAESSNPKIVNTDSVVDKQIIDSSDYRKMFDKLGENSKTTRSIFQQVKAILNHRSGSNFEDLSFIDSVTGKFLTRTDYSVKKQCVPSKSMMAMVKKAKPNTVIAIHNHPNSSVPSLDDINSAWKKKYKYGIIACHNGNIFKYKIVGDYNQGFVDFLLDKLNSCIYNEDIDTVNKILESLKKQNIEMEVFLWK